MQEIQEIQGAKGGGKGGGGSSHVAQEDPNTLQSNSIARVLFLISEGPTGGLKNGAKSVLFDGTQLEDDNGNANFKGYSFDTRNGLTVQDHFPGFPTVENQVAVGAEIKYDTPITRTISSKVDAVRVTVRVPRLTNQNKQTGDLHGSSVDIYVDVRSNGGAFTRAIKDTISGKTVSDYQRDYRVELTGEPPWDIKVGRITPDSDSSSISNETNFDGYTEIIDSKLYYPNCALLGVSIDAEQFGNKVPTISALWQGLEIQVPSNYDTITRSYEGLWDGTFKLAHSDNPAWVLYDLITNNRYGLGSNVDNRNVNKGEFYTIARYCDELVDDGYGGHEPRFTCNLYLTKQQDAYAALKQIASIFRGFVYWGAGMATVVQDSPRDSVQIVGPSNVVDGNFEYTSSTSSAERHSVALVTWNDPKDNYRPNIEVVEDKEALAKIGWKTTDIAAVGSTSRGQARRLGRWTLYSEWHEPEVVSYSCSLDHLGVRPGDIVEIYDPDVAGMRLSGRLASFEANTFTVDKLPADLDKLLDYKLSVVLSDGSLLQQKVVSFNNNTITVATTSSLSPVIGALWALTCDTVRSKKFRVASVTESDNSVFNVSAVSYNSEKYSIIDENLRFDDPTASYTLSTTGTLEPPVQLKVEDHLYADKSITRVALSVSVTLPNDPRVRYTEYEYREKEDTSFKLISMTSAVSVELKNVKNTVYLLRARTVDGVGHKSEYCESVEYKVIGKLAPPADVKNFAIQVLNDTARLTWDAVKSLDLSHYVIKHSSIHAAEWNSANLLVAHVTGTQITVPALTGVYLIKAVDTSAKESINTARIDSNVAGLQNYNVVESVSEDPIFAGVKEHCVLEGGAVQMASLSGKVLPDSIYYFKNQIDLGELFLSRLSSNVRAQGVNITRTLTTWKNLTEQKNLSNVKASDWYTELQISTTKESPKLEKWSSWSTFTIGDYNARAFRFRIKMLSNAPDTAVQITHLSATVDMQDRVVAGSDLTCPSGGTLVKFTPPFRKRPALAVDSESLQTGDRKAITKQSAEGFFLRFFDKNNKPVSRSFDYLAKGYGSKL